ncbi:hypothetical protein EV174_007021, partial [Coemansia sp. RSA 2320]
MSFFDVVSREAADYTLVTDGLEEVCELYSVYYSSSSQGRLKRVDQTLSEIEVEIQGGQREVTLTIMQNPNINGELGQTGAVLWNSSVVLSEYFARRSLSGWDLTRFNVLELGAGCGLVGMVLHRLGARRVVLTDQQRVMKLLLKNIERCQNVVKGKQRSKGSETTVFGTEYVWGRMPEDQRVLAEPVDVLVVSDCVYHEDVVPLLVKTMADVCSSREDGVPVVAVVGQELRSDL